ncbi:related to DNA damage checkpoint protein 1 [Zygosaccharomyces bailii]|nr:related to DNA damage checkpoint protein 1 [Zygosaccharomyces bailii]
MSFRASFSSSEKHSIWFRTINALTTVHSDIKFTITSAELIAWAINTTDTTLCQIKFAREFFDEYEFRPYEIVFGENGVQIVPDRDGGDTKLYSFQINGKQLTTISRKPDNDNIKEFTIMVNNTTTCPDTLANRLLVKVEMASLISKEYSPQFIPIKYDPVIINLKYKRKFLNVYGPEAASPTAEASLDPKLLEIFSQAKHELATDLFTDNKDSYPKDKDQLTIEDEINYICCNQALIRNFLDNCNANITEEIKLEINAYKLIITAFTKAIYGRNNDMLRNNMSLSNTISISDIAHYCLFTTIEENDNEVSQHSKRKDATKSIVFKLKDFKNFMTIGSSWKSSLSGNMSMWFCHKGDPLLVEIKKPGIKMELVQITESTGAGVIRDSELVATKIVSPQKRNTRVPSAIEESAAGRISPLKMAPIPSKQVRTSPLKCAGSTGSSLGERPVARQLFVKEETERSLGGWNHGTEATTLHQENCGAPVLAERSRTTVGWGQKPLDPNPPVAQIDKQSMLKKEKRKYLQELQEEQKRQKLSPGKEEEEFGPTQPTRPKGLFD